MKEKISRKVNSLVAYLNTEAGISVALLIVAIFFNAVFLWAEVSVPTYYQNDGVVHQSSIAQSSLSLKSGHNPLDFWFSQIELGYPLFNFYQNLPQFILVIADLITGNFFQISRLFDFSSYILMVLFPLSVYFATRRFGFDYLTAGFSALFASLFSTNGMFGFDYFSYVWRGWGLYTQLWGMFFLPLALAEVHRYLQKTSSLFKVVLLSSIVLLSHVFLGYILILSSIILIFIKINKEEIKERAKRFLAFFVSTGVVVSYFYIPILLDSNDVNRSVFFPSWKWDSFGAERVMTDLMTGQLFDFGRFPSITILFFIGFASIITFKLYKNEIHRLVLILSTFWLVLFFGKPTLGFFLDLIPLSSFIQFHRFIAGFHLFAIFLIGIGLSLIYSKILSSRFRSTSIIFWVLLLLLLIPVYTGQIRYYQENTFLKKETQKAFSLEKDELAEIVSTLGNLPTGRVYAGVPSTFGDYPYYKIGSVQLYYLLPQLGLDTFGFSHTAQPLSADAKLNFNQNRPAEYNLYNIRYVLLHNTWSPASFYTKIKTFSNYTLYSVDTTGYFDIVEVPAVFVGKKLDYYEPNSKWLFSTLPELKIHPIMKFRNSKTNTETLPQFGFDEMESQINSFASSVHREKGKILSEKNEINKYQAEFESNCDCYLMLKANYVSGWHAYLDSKEVDRVMLTPGFVGIKVTPGVHHAEFVYRASWYKLPLFVFGIAALFAIYFLEQLKLFYKNIKK